MICYLQRETIDGNILDNIYHKLRNFNDIYDLLSLIKFFEIKITQ
jgi:hypothetical protein